ncbi:MAG: fliS [Clostridiaceae bacterium]|jgi:flagellar protein FliS|nr:fliS [Clostridiaceae bacterium]
MYGSNAYNTYKNNSINYASKEQLLLMLVEGAVKFGKIARQAILDKKVQTSHDNIVKAQNIYYELMATLDVSQGGNWANQLMSIYEFIINRLTEANIKKDIKIMDEVIPLMEDVKDTWTEAYKISKVNK